MRSSGCPTVREAFPIVLPQSIVELRMTLTPEHINDLPYTIYTVLVSKNYTLKSVSHQCLGWLGYTMEELSRDDYRLSERHWLTRMLNIMLT